MGKSFMSSRGCVSFDPAPCSAPSFPKLERLTCPYSPLFASSFFSAYSAALRVLCVKDFFRFQLSTLNFEPLPSSHFLFSIFYFPLKSNVSPACPFFAHNPFVSPTYAKTGGCTPVQIVFYGVRQQSCRLCPVSFSSLLAQGL